MRARLRHALGTVDAPAVVSKGSSHARPDLLPLMTPRVSLLPIVEFGAKLAGTVGRKPDLDTFLKTLPESPGPSGIGRDDIAEPLGVLWHSLECPQHRALAAPGATGGGEGGTPAIRRRCSTALET